MATWETLKAKPSIESIYLPCLKLTITSGSFILYESKVDGNAATVLQVGRVLQVVKSIDMIPESDRYPAICQEPVHEGDRGNASRNDIPLQFIRINVFKSHAMFAEEDFAVDADNSVLSSHVSGGWKYLVQMEEDDWILADSIINLSFVFPEDEVSSHRHDDCRGMFNFFVLKHRRARNGCVSFVPKQACPPFGSQLEGFGQYWSVDNCQVIFNSIRQIGRAMQRLLCRIAQSQGDFSSRNTKLHMPSCSWLYIKNQFEAKGIVNTCRVAFSQPRPILAWGLTYHCIRENGNMEVLRFDTGVKIQAFREVFGSISGYGVRKKRPRYSEGQSLLNMNDVINVVCFPCEDDGPQEIHDSSSQFQRFSVMEDGIDLLYDECDGLLQLVVRYRKLVVTNESIPFLADAGVGMHGSRIAPTSTDQHDVLTTEAGIFPGMDFMDGDYLMRVTSVGDNVIYARRTYKLVGNRSIAVYGGCDNDMEFSDISDIHDRIQAMLE